MKKLFFISLLCICNITVSQESITKNIGDFSTLKVFNGIEVVLIKSSDQKLEISGKKADLVKIKNVNNILKLSLPFSVKPSDNYADGDVLINLYYNKNIDILDANEGATITGKDFNQNQITVNAQERAFINLTIKSTNLNVVATSGGIIKLTGVTEYQDVRTDLYGIYHGFNLKSTAISNVKAGTGAKAEILSGGTLNAKVSFGGSIFYKGKPENITTKKVIGGIIQNSN
ncbi:head GIN domain-containing protein [uncultured Polaribacter sp.]|uniref:head GIN domain-containing protein n=1 Tax=uncultured Polaribacter sp. TaxID=174711 RepID=UPI00262D80AB|nr:head GIN domain-containing protein [uncultured Polaribacter sp.]